MREPRLLVAILAVLSLALFAGACGGDDGGESDEDQITEAVEQAATSDSEERCTEYQTVAFTEQTEFESGDAAVQTCEDNAGDGDKAADSVEVSAIEVDGDNATAEVAFEGAGLNGQTLAVSLVKEDDRWKLDSLDEFVEFDQAALTEAIVAEASADEETPQEVVDCVEQTLSSADPTQIQTAYLSGDANQLAALFGACFGGQ